MDDEVNDEAPITLQEALEEYEELEKVSMAVLGASDPQNCSYPKGYLKRQALYACLTCNPKKSPEFQPGGVCLACTFKCHDGHDLIELYTKRNFRCDCGNKKFSDNPCVLFKDKDELNSLNSYNQNFKGEYCTCHRPYPDPEESDDNLDAMIQCVVCEDWLHSQHAIPGITLADYDDGEQGLELICGSCMSKVDFLSYYGSLQAKPLDFGISVTVDQDGSEETNEESNFKDPNEVTQIPTDSIINDPKTIPNSNVTKEKTVSDSNGAEDSASQDSGIDYLSGSDTLSAKTNVSNPAFTAINKCDDCIFMKESKIQYKSSVGTIWSDGWRKKLCLCTKCKEMYKSSGVGFLTDEEDTIESYEAVGKAKSESDQIKAEESFNKKVDALGRVGQIELISGYNDMKEALTEFLKDFSKSGKVVEKKDVQEFFETFRAEHAAKRRRIDESLN